MTDQAFDLLAHQRTRIRHLDSRCHFLEGERDRLEQLLAVLLRMAARTANCDPTLILDACCTIIETDPALAHIHQPEPAVDDTQELAA